MKVVGSALVAVNVILLSCIAGLLSRDSRPIVAVFGASGMQGQALVRGLLASQSFRVRVLSRSAKSGLWQENDENLHIFLGDMSDKRTVERFLSGAWGCFLVTFSDFRHGTEIHVGKMISQAALQAGVQHLVFSR